MFAYFNLNNGQVVESRQLFMTLPQISHKTLPVFVWGLVITFGSAIFVKRLFA